MKKYRRFWCSTLPLAASLTLCLGPPSGAQKETAVTLALDQAPLAQVAAELTRQSGVLHRVMAGERPPRVVLFCREQPAGRVRAAITGTLGWTWSRGESAGRPVYTLTKPMALRRREAELREKSWREYHSYLTGLLEMVQDPSKAPPDDGSPVSFQVHGRQGRGMLRSLAVLPPRTLAGVLAGKPYAVPASAAGREVKQLLAPRREEGMANVPGTELRPNDTVRIELARDASGRPESLQVAVFRGGKLVRQLNGAHASAHSAVAKDEEPNRAGYLQQQLQEAPELNRPSPRMPPLEQPKILPSYIGWQLRDLSRRISLPILADCYPAAEFENPMTRIRPISVEPLHSPPNDGKTPIRVLDDLRITTQYEWQVKNGWLLMRYDHWYWEPLRSSRKSASSP